VISGGVMGAGAAKRLSAVRWGIAGNMVGAWILTLPAAGAMGGIAYGITRIFGENNAAGPIVVILLLVTALGLGFARRFREPSSTAVVARGAEA
jgi:PiT family inorganic phosphate transporter